MRNCLQTLAALLVLFLACGCQTVSSRPTGEEVALPTMTFSFDEKDYPSKDNLFPEYHIAPGDLLDVLFQISSGQRKEGFRIKVDHSVSVKFVHLPQLNETQKVKPDGKISLPYIGEVSVTGRTIEELTKDLQKRYAKTLRDPELYVMVPEFSTQIKELKKDLHTATRGLSRLVTVRPDGHATFPLLGDVFVAGQTVPETSKMLDKKYEKVMPGLHVDLFLEKTVGSMVYVLGRVKEPGRYAIQKPVTGVQALSIAGGHLTDASLKHAILFRRKERQYVATRLNLETTLTLKDGAALFYLRPDDILYIPRSRIAFAGQLMQEISNIFLFKGWNLDASLYDGGIFGKRDK